MASQTLVKQVIYENYGQDTNQFDVFSLEYSTRDETSLITLLGNIEATLPKYQNVTLRGTNLNGMIKTVVTDNTNIDRIKGFTVTSVIQIPEQEIIQAYASRKYRQQIYPAITSTIKYTGKKVTSVFALSVKRIEKPTMIGTKIVSSGLVVLGSVLKNWPRNIQPYDQIDLLYIPSDKIGQLADSDLTLELSLNYTVISTSLGKLLSLNSIAVKPINSEIPRVIGLSTILGNYAGIATLPTAYPHIVQYEQNLNNETTDYIFVSTDYLLSSATITNISSLQFGLYRIETIVEASS